ncbi:fibrillin-1 [Trichoplusia ni]|uniref:Fibrillin-1 n=1 Tax=Trichoplusia ni TaxID=7111 RepID=A0A7E5VQ62_TRINI|nr:fibrillin-1 [Trichoplusia ni]
MRCFAVCMLLIVTLCPGTYGYLSDDMKEAIQLCCNEGAGFARNHTLEACQGSLSTPPEVPPEFGAMCVIAKAQCCKEYFRKQVDCAAGADISTGGSSCDSAKAESKLCCNECAKGTKLGSSKGPEACVKAKKGISPEQLLADDAFLECCKKAAKNWKGDSPRRSSNYITLSTLPSLCEEYAPNELCAHHCLPVPGSYKCKCNPGFMLMADGKNCMEVTKNRCKPRNDCQHKCNDDGKRVTCSCRRGYELMADGKSCQDIDECKLEVPVCLPGTQCHNVQGSYKCIPLKKHNVEKGQCPLGFSRNIDNHACDDINECLLPNPPCPAYLCENTIGGYKCGGVTGDPINLNTSPRPMIEDRCPPGFKIGVHGDCEDVDECEAHQHDCNPLSQFCINTHSSFYCQDKASKHCPPGFKIDISTNKCEDINECEDGGDLCRHDQVCVNQLGQYDCKTKEDPRVSSTRCPDGMRKKPGNLYCEDIDECVEGTHLCDQHQSCLNTNGSYECHCKLGYEHDPMTGACIDVNECATGQHECIPQAQRCDNTVGSYLCVRITSCGTGYVLHHSTGKCEDINECALDANYCGKDYKCINIRGSFRCVRKQPSTTSTTTLPPEAYEEYEYYDSEEEVEGNTTVAAPPKKPSTTTTLTPKPETPTTSSTTTEQPKQPEPQPEDNNVEPPTTVKINKEEKENIPKNQPDVTYSNPRFQPRPTESSPTDPQPSPTNEPEQPEIVTLPTEPQPRQPEVTYNPKPPEYIPEAELPKQPEEEPRQPEPTYPPPTEPTNESIQPERQPETTYSSEPTSSERPSPTPPYQVNVDVGRETATVEGEKKPDGSVVVDTNSLPKNQWTKINTRPSDCPLGFEADEYGSCFDIDECATNRHSCSGLTEVCRNTVGGYTCSCAPGFRRDLVTKACDVITTSSTTTTTTTRKSLFWGYPEYKVTARPFRPRNLCDAGYHHNARTGQCEDVNECTNGQANCAAVEICINTEGGFRCECPPNWRLDEVRHRCVRIKNNGKFPTGYGNQPTYPTVPLKPVVHTPVITFDPEITQIEDRGSVFRCPAGYSLGDDNTCVDVNECITGEAKCGPQQICANLPGGYSCNCPSGHRLIGDHECEDVDECALAGKVPVCSQNADCVNTIGSYQCKCHTGFRSAPVNDKVCVDVDECMESRSGSLCQHRCNNVWGSYRCSCHRGYRLNLDNSTCSDVDECEEFKSKIPCVGKCLNEPGSYRCACPQGYRLSEDKRSCIDIDECETGEAQCASSSESRTASDVCVNTRGSYRCQRVACPPGYQLENKHRCNKVERVCQAGDWKCAQQPTTISYNFITFVSNLYIPDSKLKLFTMRGPVWPFAKMRFVLRIVDVNAPPNIKRKADISDFLLTQNNNEGLTSLVRPLEGPQSIELEMSMELYTHEQFGGTAIAKLFIYVSEYEF